MNSRPKAARIRIVPVVTSTNDTILEAGERGEPEGTTHIAWTQTRGRGRGSHSWFSPAGAGLWMSTLLRPTRGREFWGALSLMEACAAREALSALGVPGVEVRWPNDLFARGKKLGGVLGEVRARGGEAWLALGIGINIDFRTPEVQRSLPAELRDAVISLAECGSPETLDPVKIGLAVLERFWGLYERFEGGEDVLADLGRSIAHIGREVTVRVGGRPPWRGTIEGLGPRGELLLRTQTDPSAVPPPGTEWCPGRSGIAALVSGEVTYE